jgi:ElaB/YqjD/DUF883 family membrane-anchored ribosome-binding protein
MFTGNVLEAKNKLVADFDTVIEDTEELLQATASQANEKVVAARARVQESIKAAKQKFGKVEDVALGKVKAADSYVHEHTWPVIGVAAAVGALVGILMSRR